MASTAAMKLTNVRQRIGGPKPTFTELRQITRWKPSWSNHDIRDEPGQTEEQWTITTMTMTPRAIAEPLCLALSAVSPLGVSRDTDVFPCGAWAFHRPAHRRPGRQRPGVVVASESPGKPNIMPKSSNKAIPSLPTGKNSETPS